MKAIVRAVFVVAVLCGGPLRGEQVAKPAGQESETELAKETQNPVADLISVPFQNNFNFGAGPRDATNYVLNVQPVIPFHLNDDWNVITRTIASIISAGSPAPGVDHVGGLGDIQPAAFLSPAKPGSVIWGAGPIMTLPTASNRNLGNGKWAAGPAVVGLTMHGPWVVGALVNNQWSFAGWGDRDVKLMTIQPLVYYNFGHGWYLASVPIMTADWTRRASDAWTVPVGGGGGKLLRVGKVGLPVNVQIQGFYNAVRPDNSADWQLRFQLQLLLPR
jgi:hypothetical protein